MVTPETLAQAVDVVSVRDEWERAVIGASAVGNDCDTYLALELRGLPSNKIEPRLLRIFDLGKAIETLVEGDLGAALHHLSDGGLVMLAEDPRTDKQWEFHRYGRLSVAHPDGLVFTKEEVANRDFSSPEWVVEIKSMKQSKFDAFVEQGVKSSHPGYYRQMQMQMGYTGSATHCIFAAYNKDTSAYSFEIVEFDAIVFASLMARIEFAMRKRVTRQQADRSSFRCRFCFKSEACWGDLRPKKSCRTCAHSEAQVDGRWWCTKKDAEAVRDCWDYAPFAPAPKGTKT